LCTVYPPAKVLSDVPKDYNHTSRGKLCTARVSIYSIRVQNPAALIKALAEKDISCGIHYPIPIHLQGAYHFLEQRRGSFPLAERCAEEFLSLPMFPELTEEQIEHVVKEIKNRVET
jgi:dTDP-4-amino-4,6-dideoxygalactose transaminase